MSGVRYEHLVAGVSGGVISTLVLHPLDLLKIRFAVHDGSPGSVRPSYASGLRSAVTTIVRTDGLRGLYAGMSPNLVGAGSAWGLYFLFYNTAKFQLQDGVVSKQLPASSSILAASFSGVLTLTCTNPVWVVKTRLCLQSSQLTSTHTKGDPKLYHGFTDALIKIWKYEGLRGLYSGYLPGIFGVSHGVVQFVAYEELKNCYHNYYNQAITTKLGTAEYLTFAAISKLVAALTTYPYQVIRARLQDHQKDYTGSLDCIHKTFSREGLGGFYKGLSPNLLRVVPATMITFVVYENISHFLINRKRKGEEEPVVGIVSLPEGKEEKSGR